MTLLVNVYGGPGTGKSTTAAGVFYDLKMRGVNCEIAHEFAKDLVWDRSDESHFECQPRIAGEQIWRIERLQGQVDVVITDSPILFCSIYLPSNSKIGASFESFLRQQHFSWNSFDFFLQRDDARPYNPRGRNQSEEEARQLDDLILKKLAAWRVPFCRVPMGSARPLITRRILRALR